MRATEFEFRYRFWVMGLIFWVSFACYSFDHVNAGVAFTRWLVGGRVDPHSPQFLFVLRSVFAFGAVLAIAAAAIRTWGAAYLKSAVVHDLDLHNEMLVADGPFRWTRNPLYLGGVLLGAGIGFMASRLGWFVLVILIYVFYMRLIAREESELRKTQGASYAAYCARVPRFWPALTPRVASGGMKPRWKQAFAGEFFLWAAAVAMVIFAVTLNQRITYSIIGVALLAYAVYVFGFRRRRSAQTVPSRKETI
jgi:protein-S-isoprenylcysteine O-methyltransferase Ste14